ncbi:hypothetical protein [Lewinella sp. 4G2]|uniref:DUF6992 family protein n=1 Tax=Lewinella sp. 4G2 TaxID=1803372 RepID=UPI0007B4AC0D|nr:hypothetical protein [Lewinella sp. 4G2]OAV44490.1 hypothetical protein A3850_008295 [Lewinella sp. 4G2]
MMSLKTGLTTLILLSSCLLFAQVETDLLATYNQASLQQQKVAMLTLGGWAVANIGTGLALRGGSEGATRRFHEMNALWNTVNLAIAGFGYYSYLQADPAGWDLATSMQKHQQFQKILLFNTGLDVGYVLGGLYLTERAKRPGVDTDQLKGYGNSIMLQGGFLFVFDLVNYVIATKLNGTLPLRLGGTADGLGLLLNF